MGPTGFLVQSNIDSIVSVDFREVATRIGSLNSTDQSRLLDALSVRFSDNAWTRNVTKRIALARTLVGLLPNSTGLLKHLLASRARYIDFEIHFTLFCYLDWTCEIDELRSLAAEVLALTQVYMLTIRTPQARAAWMAGDMLGDHWEPMSASEALVDVLTNARTPIGRLAALYGVERLLQRAAERSVLISALQERARKDPSRRVREEIRTCLVSAGVEN